MAKAQAPAGPAGMLGVLRDKRVLAGAAVAGGVGLVVLLTRKGSGAAPAQTAPQLDSSQSDLYNALQDINARWRSDLNGWTEQLQDVADRLPDKPSTGTGSVTGRVVMGHAVEDMPTGPRPVRPGRKVKKSAAG